MFIISYSKVISVGNNCIEFTNEEKEKIILDLVNPNQIVNLKIPEIIKIFASNDISCIFTINEDEEVNIYSIINGSKKEYNFNLNNEDEDLLIDKVLRNILPDIDIIIEINK